MYLLYLIYSTGNAMISSSTLQRNYILMKCKIVKLLRTVKNPQGVNENAKEKNID